MYKAIKKIGEFKVGDVVPDSKAETWLEMYEEPHVEKVVEQVRSNPIVNVRDKPAQKKTSLEDVRDEYLGRNQSVVKEAIIEDDLNEIQLKELLKLEEDGKQRPLIINLIKQKLRGN